jgi:cell division protein FtsB
VLARLLWSAVIIAALLFAVQGGEYSTLDLVRQRRERVRLTMSIDSLSRVVDSLRRYHDRLLHDPKLQERIAREDFGMVRGTKELLYRFAEPRDSAAADSLRRDRRPK